MSEREIINPQDNTDVNPQDTPKGEQDNPNPNAGGQEESFKLPEQFASKGWAKNTPEFKTKDDYINWISQEYDKREEFLGGKLDKYAEENGLIKPPDWANEEAVKEFFNKITPEDVNKYPTGEFKDESAKELFNNAFKEAGVTEKGAKKLIETFNQYNQSILEQATNKEDYDKEMTELFGRDYEQVKQPIDNMLKGLISQDEMQVINDELPNKHVKIMYKIAKGLADKYGHKEDPKGGTNPDEMKGMSKEEKFNKHAELTKKITELNNRPHTAEEKQALIDQLTNIYK